MFKPLALCCSVPLALAAAVGLVLGGSPPAAVESAAPAPVPPAVAEDAPVPPAAAQATAIQTTAVQAALFEPRPVRTPNPQIDYDGFLRNAAIVGQVRSERRVSEADFLKMAREEGTVVLDARSREKFALMHIQRAVNLPMPDFTEDELAAIIPTKTARVLIYCNNNFWEEPRAFPTKSVVLPSETSFAVSLNIHTFNQLYNYGYRNVYELAPVIDPADSALPFAGRGVAAPAE